MDEPLLSLAQGARELGIELDSTMLSRFSQYCDLLLDYNEKVNLTAIRERPEVMRKHFLDSILPLCCTQIPENAAVIDVGTGAGFPGVPLQIVRQDLQLTLLDSLNKRLLFLQQLLSQLGLSAALVHERAEEAGRKPLYREQYDLAVSRAVAPLPVLCELCLPFVKVGGSFLAFKGPDAPAELEDARGAIALLGAKVERVSSFELPGVGMRSIVELKKCKKLSPIYPRHGSKIAKKPLVSPKGKQ